VLRQNQSDLIGNTMPSSILLIDDSPGECELFRQALTQSGIQGPLGDQPMAAVRQ
jgi:PleD family two-component response regulator